MSDDLSPYLTRIDLAVACWDGRDTPPDAVALRAAQHAVTHIDELTRELHTLRQRLVTELRHEQDATAARADALLNRGRRQ